VHARRAGAQAHLLVRATAEDPVPPRWEAHPVGLAEPTAGGVTVLGGRPPGSPAALDGIAFVAQDTPV